MGGWWWVYLDYSVSSGLFFSSFEFFFLEIELRFTIDQEPELDNYEMMEAYL